ncbi:hypothetical protein LNV23_04415 [Paucibacter sp. DJ1R-11]|uniref:hypothetical protein n=1 Tax=Paucibacter sp. DJ1R-11 TaxID=2893556 RepID=UPI0021E40B36|nr:hypothetical protein [Paucibacter sp. DJ1R-11]MCV2362692.1 hypothetical protein [Paucibacter sp. DJ1R-11]
MSDSFEKDEYFALVKAVADFDQRLLTVKGWGVTLSLAALGLGFQYRAYGFFLIAAASSLAFWVIEHAGKRHQMRHYVRIREIEFNQYQRASAAEKAFSSPRTDWSWQTASETLAGEVGKAGSPLEQRGRNKWYGFAGLLPHVALPHAITLAIGLFFFCQGYQGSLPTFTLGNPPAATSSK